MNNKTPWYRIKAAADSSPAELEIFGDIGESWWAEESITAKSISKELKPLAGRDLNVRINSYGGSVADGLAIYNALRRHAQSAKVTTSNEGVAMSIASLIFMAGDVREMSENAIYMIHAPWAFAAGNSKDMRDMADVLDKYAESMSSAYARSSLSTDEIKSLLTDGEDHFYSAAEAEESGFATSVRKDLPIAASYFKNRFTFRASAPINLKESLMTTEKPNGAEPVAAASHAPETPKPEPESDAIESAETATRHMMEAGDIATRAVQAERERVFAIRDAVRLAKLDDSVADEMIRAGKSLDQCRDDIWRRWADRVDATATQPNHSEPAYDKRSAEIAQSLLKQVSGVK